MIEYKSFLNKFSLKLEKSNFKKTQITSSKTSYDYIKNFYFDDIEIFESFFILLLNRANNTIGYTKISQGGITGTVVDIRLLAKYCIDSLACSVILAHNHPSGNEKPSQEDINLTSKVKQGLKYLDVNVLDHIILTENNYYSFADEGMI